MENAFAIVVLAVGAVGVLGAVIALLTGRRAWEQLGRDRLFMESELRTAGGRRAAAERPLAPGARAERDAEVRQMLQARNARRRRRGEPELDTEAELARLTGQADPARPADAPDGTTRPAAIDRELAGEIRQLVIARNHRRARRGEPPLDVETEVARELARLSG